MKPRLLKKLLSEVQKEHSIPDVDTPSYKLAKSSIILSSVFSVIAIIFVIYQICVSPDKLQMSELLYKQESILESSQIQIDSLISINKKLSKQVDIARDQYNMNAEIAAFKSRDYLIEKYNSFNNIVDAIVEMEPILNYHRAKRDGKMTLRSRYIDKRIEALDHISDCLKKMVNIGSFVDDKKIVNDYGDYLSAIYQYKLMCIDYKREIGNIDTSLMGQNVYDSVMNNVIDLNDRILPILDIGRSNVKIELDEVLHVIKVNDSMRRNELK